VITFSRHEIIVSDALRCFAFSLTCNTPPLAIYRDSPNDLVPQIIGLRTLSSP
jgi:hypothetical protein